MWLWDLSVNANIGSLQITLWWLWNTDSRTESSLHEFQYFLPYSPLLVIPSNHTLFSRLQTIQQPVSFGEEIGLGHRLVLVLWCPCLAVLITLHRNDRLCVIFRSVRTELLIFILDISVSLHSSCIFPLQVECAHFDPVRLCCSNWVFWHTEIYSLLPSLEM